MAERGRREELVRLGFVLEGRENAERFGKIGERIAKVAEETARRVSEAGDKLATSWDVAVKRYRTTSGQFAPGSRVTEGLYDWIELQRHGMASVGAALPQQDIYDWIAGTRQAGAEISKTYANIGTAAGQMVVDTTSGFYRWKQQHQAVEESSKSLGTTLGNFSVEAVAAYTAAATAVYAFGRAVVMAFNQAEEAAQQRAMREALISMGDYFDVQSGRIVESLKHISDQTLSTRQAIMVTNQALIAGARPFAESVPRLFEIARASAVATGKDIMWVFDTLVRGIARAEPRLIDNANIYLSVTEAAREMAEAEGKVYEELNRQERMVYALNAVLQEGESLINAVSQEALDAQQPFQRLRGEVRDLVDAFWASVTAGEAIPDALDDLADAIEDLQPKVARLGAYIAALNAVFLDLRDSFLVVRIAGALMRGDAESLGDALADLYDKGKEAADGADTASEALNRLADILDFDPATTWQEALERNLEEGMQAIGEFYDEMEPRERYHLQLSMEVETEGEEELSEFPAEYQRYLERLYGLEEDAFEQRLQAGRDFAEDLLDLERDLAEDRRDILQDYADEVADIGREYGDRLADIQREAGDREQEAVADYQDDMADLRRDHARTLLDIERDYREEVLRIEEDYEMELWEAVGERDATAVLKAERRRKLQLRRARRDRDRETQEANEDYQDRAQDLRESYEKRRQEARDYRQNELAELQRWRDRRLREAKIDRDRELRDLQQTYSERLQELEDHHAERVQEILDEYNYEREIARIEYEYREDAYRRHLERMRAIRDEYLGAGMGAPAGPTGIPGYGPSGAGPETQTAAPAGPTGIPGYGPGASGEQFYQQQSDALAQYQEEIARIEEQIAKLTGSSGDHWEEQSKTFGEFLNEQEGSLDDYEQDTERSQERHQREQLRSQDGYFRADSQAGDSHRRRELRAEAQYQNTQLRYSTQNYSAMQRYYVYHLNDLERALYNHFLQRKFEYKSYYYWELRNASQHYQDVEEMYRSHLKRLWLLFNLFGTPPAPTPGVPEVMGKYSVEKSAAQSHYQDVEKMYERHLKELWSLYERIGSPGGEGRGVGTAVAGNGGRAVPQPRPAATTVDLSGVDLNHSVRVAIQNELAGIEGRITNGVTRIMREVF